MEVVMEVLFIYFVPGVGHIKHFIDATPVLTDGATEEEAIEWAYEKYGRGREVVNVEFGTREYLMERVALAYHHVEIEEE
jgi:hypothetical protein